jgi:hypothetical protein
MVPVAVISGLFFIKLQNTAFYESLARYCGYKQMKLIVEEVSELGRLFLSQNLEIVS